MTKKCSKCKIEKPVEDFNRKSKDKLQSFCRLCQREHFKLYYQLDGGVIRSRTVESNAKQKKLVKEYIKNYLLSHPCVDCGNTDTRVLDFDHVRGSKKYNVTTMVTNGLETVKKEIEKCEVRCANCHRIVTHERRIIRVSANDKHPLSERGQ